jgi:hypothetical protein
MTSFSTASTSSSPQRATNVFIVDIVKPLPEVLERIGVERPGRPIKCIALMSNGTLLRASLLLLNRYMHYSYEAYWSREKLQHGLHHGNTVVYHAETVHVTCPELTIDHARQVLADLLKKNKPDDSQEEDAMAAFKQLRSLVFAEFDAIVKAFPTPAAADARRSAFVSWLTQSTWTGQTFMNRNERDVLKARAWLKQAVEADADLLVFLQRNRYYHATRYYGADDLLWWQLSKEQIDLLDWMLQDVPECFLFKPIFAAQFPTLRELALDEHLDSVVRQGAGWNDEGTRMLTAYRAMHSMQRTQGSLCFSADMLNHDALASLISVQAVIPSPFAGAQLLYLRETWEAQCELVRLLAEVLSWTKWQPSQSDRWAFSRDHLDPVQRQALTMMEQQPLSLVTGGPGVGKSEVAKHAQRKGHTVLYLAPTGNATAVLQQRTGQMAYVIHWILNVAEHDVGLSSWNNSQGSNIRRRKKQREANEDEDEDDTEEEEEEEEDKKSHKKKSRAPTTTKNPSGLSDFVLKPWRVATVAFIDESSMVDIFLALRLFRFLVAVKKKFGVLRHIVLCGDPNQLPSVDCAAFLRDLIRSGLIPCTQLTVWHRGDQGSKLIIDNADRILQCSPQLVTGPAFEMRAHLSDKEVTQLLQEHKDKVTFTGFTNVKIDGLNQLAMKLHGYAKGVLAVGQRIVFRRNQYRSIRLPSNGKSNANGGGGPRFISRLAVTNGLTGTVEAIRDVRDAQKSNGSSSSANTTTIDRKSTAEPLPAQFIRQLVLRTRSLPNSTPMVIDITSTVLHTVQNGDARTVHTFQGGEGDLVVYFATERDSLAVLYTGITRAKKKVILVATPAMLAAICKRGHDERVSELIPLLRKELENRRVATSVREMSSTIPDVEMMAMMDALEGKENIQSSPEEAAVDAVVVEPQLQQKQTKCVTWANPPREGEEEKEKPKRKKKSRRDKTEKKKKKKKHREEKKEEEEEKADKNTRVETKEDEVVPMEVDSSTPEQQPSAPASAVVWTPEQQSWIDLFERLLAAEGINSISPKRLKKEVGKELYPSIKARIEETFGVWYAALPTSGAPSAEAGSNEAAAEPEPEPKPELETVKPKRKRKRYGVDEDDEDYTPEKKDKKKKKKRRRKNSDAENQADDEQIES